MMSRGFGRAALFGDDPDEPVASQNYSSISSAAIQKYYHDVEQLKAAGDWVSLPEVPTAAELLRPVRNSSGWGYGNVDGQAVPYNRGYTAWESTEDYLASQYAFCREESTFALRAAIEKLRRRPQASEPDLRKSCSGIGIYEKARVTGVTFETSKGVVSRMSFSTDRSKLRIDWETSSRLKTNSLVAISPSSDMFRERVLPGIVAARPLSLLSQNPPQVDIFFPHDIVFDPSIEYVILEETTTYFESMRHNMLALQKMSRERSTLTKYLVDPRAFKEVGTVAMAETVASDPSPKPYMLMDLSSVLGLTLDPSTGFDYTRVDVCSDWPSQLSPQEDMLNLDVSQMEALKQMLSKEIALIQGPPGTGKTHVSVAALSVLLGQMKPNEPPIIVACQTNHALDQLLRHVAPFVPHFIRLGGRTADLDVIKPRTLYEVGQELPYTPSKTSRDAGREMKRLEKEMVTLLKPFDPVEGFFDHHILLKHDAITQQQFDSLEFGHLQNPPSHSTPRDRAPVGPITTWLSNNIHSCSAAEQTPTSLSFADFEEGNEEELTGEVEAGKPIHDDATEALKGSFLPLLLKWTTDSEELIKPDSMEALFETIKLPRFSDLGSVESHQTRCKLYKIMIQSCKQKIATKFSRLAAAYSEQARRRRIGKFEADLEILKGARLIGLTTTGLSKYRALVAATEARVVMLEEAGESLECTVAPAFLPTVRHLIQVGDHKQLRPRPQKQEHEKMRWDVSLFERLVNNQVEMRMLRRQRRMRAEIARLIHPVYGPELENFEEVDLRPAVPGMGDVNTWFMDHDFAESRDSHKSALNEEEADLIVEFAAYLVRNGTRPEQISILTFYNGQKRYLQKLLEQHSFLSELAPVGVHTVDSFQGEENAIILLSLVRSTNVGFIANRNRVTVALSRARLGLYIFGNRYLLQRQGGRLWQNVIDILDDNGPDETRFSSGDEDREFRTGRCLYLVCGCGIPTHETDRQACREMCARSHEPRTTEVYSAADLEGNDGGCNLECGALLECGHNCPLKCHPTQHSDVSCYQRCLKQLECGHVCLRYCCAPCGCDECGPSTSGKRPAPGTAIPANRVVSTSRSWAAVSATASYPDAQSMTSWPSQWVPIVAKLKVSTPQANPLHMQPSVDNAPLSTKAARAASTPKNPQYTDDRMSPRELFVDFNRSDDESRDDSAYILSSDHTDDAHNAESVNLTNIEVEMVTKDFDDMKIMTKGKTSSGALHTRSDVEDPRA